MLCPIPLPRRVRSQARLRGFAYPVEGGFEQHFFQFDGYETGHETSEGIVNHWRQASLEAETRVILARNTTNPKPAGAFKESLIAGRLDEGRAPQK